MIVLDYVYYTSASLYRLRKSDRDSNIWKPSGVMLSALFLGFFILFFLIIGQSKHSIELTPPFGVAVGLVCMILLGIRYTWFTSYEAVGKKLKSLSETQKWILNIFTAIYLLIAIPGSITVIALGFDYFK